MSVLIQVPPALCEEESADGFPVNNLAAFDHCECLNQRKAFDGQLHLAFLELLTPVRWTKIRGKKDMELFITESRSRVDRNEFLQLAGHETGFFFEFPRRTHRRILAGVQLSGRELQQMVLHRIAKLMDEEDRLIIKEGDHDSAARMRGDLSDAAVAGRIFDLVNHQTEHPSGVPTFAL